MKRLHGVLAGWTIALLTAYCGTMSAQDVNTNPGIPWLPPSALSPPVPAPFGPNSPRPALGILGRGINVTGSRIFNGAPPQGGRGPYYGGGWYRPYGYFANRPL